MSENSYHAFVPGDALLAQVKAGSIKEKAKLYKGDISNIKFNTYLYLYVCVIGVVRRFQQYVSHITTVATQSHYHDAGPTSHGFICLMLTVLSRKQPVPM